MILQKFKYCYVCDGCFIHNIVSVNFATSYSTSLTDKGRGKIAILLTTFSNGFW